MTVDAAEIESFVGRNASYYASKWQRFADKPGYVPSFNVAAAVFGLFWLVYRRLYIHLAWVVVVLAVDISLSFYVEEQGFFPPDVIFAWDVLASLLYIVVIGALGNYWYWNRFRKVAMSAKSRYADQDKQLQFLQHKGGTNTIAVWTTVVLLFIPLAWALYWAGKGIFGGYVFDATGPLSIAEVDANFISRMEVRDEAQRQCVLREVEQRAAAAGDPETLDPASVEFLPEAHWGELDAQDKRLILSQAIVTKAFFECK